MRPPNTTNFLLPNPVFVFLGVVLVGFLGVVFMAFFFSNLFFSLRGISVGAYSELKIPKSEGRWPQSPENWVSFNWARA
jgi:hypothetical protein